MAAMRRALRNLLLLDQVSGAGGVFVGPYDAIPTLAVLLGLRRLRADYLGALLRLVRNDDDAQSDFGYVVNGDLDVAAIATWLGGSNGLVRTVYGQVGGINATQTTKANMPLYVASGQNGKPTIRLDGVNDHLLLGDLSAVFPSAATLVVAVANISDADYIVYRSGDGADGYWRELGGAAGYISTFRTARIPGYPAAAFVPSSGDALFSLISSASTYEFFKNGASAGTQAAAYSAGTSHAIGLTENGNPLKYLTGDICELVLADAVLSALNRQAAEAAANAYWSLY